jgi:hypothetical protein
LVAFLLPGVRDAHPIRRVEQWMRCADIDFPDVIDATIWKSLQVGFFYWHVDQI